MRSLFVGSVTALSLGVVLWLAWRYALPLPYWDEWLWVPYATGDRPVTLEWLWEPYNEHRLPLPKLIYLGWATLTGMNVRVLAIGNTLAFGAIAIASIGLAHRLRGGRTSYFDAFFPLLLLHGTHLENLIWPFQIGFVLPAGLTILILFLVIGKRPIGIGICLLILSLCGPVGLPVIILLSPWVIARGRSVAATVLASLAGIIGILHFIGLERPEAVAPSPSIGASLHAGVKCLATGMGQRAVEIWPFSGILVLALVGIGFLLIHRARAYPLGLALAGLCALAFGIGHARAGLGEEPIFVYRYTTIICPVLWIVYVAGLLPTPRRRSRAVRAVLAAMVGVLLWPNTEDWVRRWRERAENGEAVLADVRAGEPMDDLIDRHWRDWFPHRRPFADGMAMLGRARLSVFRHHPPGPAASEDPPLWDARIDERGSPDSGDAVRIGKRSWALYAHPRSVFSLPAPGETTGMRVSFGILEGAYRNGGATDGVEFRIHSQGLIWSQVLDPVQEPAHRGTQEVTIELPSPMLPGDRIILETLSGPEGDPTWDWAYWADIRFVTDPP